MARPSSTVRRTAIAVGAAYALTLRGSGVELDGWMKSGLGYLPTALVLAVVTFDVWLWRQSWILKMHKRPWIGGLWRVSLQPDARSQIPDGGNRGPIECYLVVDQNFWSVSLVQLTAESRSDSRAAAFVGRNSSSSRQLLSFTYDNVPKQEHLERSPKSAGACDLTVGRGAPTRIEGSYFTDRLTAGSMQLELVDRTTNYENFIDAKAHADSSR